MELQATGRTVIEAKMRVEKLPDMPNKSWDGGHVPLHYHDFGLVSRTQNVFAAE